MPSLLLVAVLLAVSACRPASEPGPPVPTGPTWFEDVTERVGLDFVHDAGPPETFAMAQIMGSGAALFDADGDGRLDILLLQHGGPTSRSGNRLYLQQPDGTFRNASAGSGLDYAAYGTGVAVGDLDNDGRPDLALTEFGGLRLFRNLGAGRFADITRTAGVASALWGTSAVFFDFDRDGLLDLAVANYVAYNGDRLCHNAAGQRDYCHPSQFPGQPTLLFRNLGPGPAGAVRFEDVTTRAGLAAQPEPGLGIVAADFDGDGWPDLLVANDGRPNRLWLNQRNGSFRDEAVARGLAYNGLGQAQANMGIALGDVDGDGLTDVFITHLTEETNALWRQGPRGFWRERTAGSGLGTASARGTGFGTVLADFDQDGHLDIAIANGRVVRGRPAGEVRLGPHWSRYAEKNRLFAGDGRGVFRDVSPANSALCGEPGIYRGMAVGDVDVDGALDLLVTEVAGRARLLRNVVPGRGHGLLVRVVDPKWKRDALGAEVTVRVGERRLVGRVMPGGSYQSSSDPRVHFGLGEAPRVDGIEVRWPEGGTEVFAGVEADRAVVLERGRGRPAPLRPGTSPIP